MNRAGERIVTSVSSFIESLLSPLDVGGLKMAHGLERQRLLMMGLVVGGSIKGSNFSLGVTTLD
jgi:predicted dinucleotide-binding enzyme